MANTSSAKKAARQMVRRTEINKSRRSRLKSSVRKVEEAIRLWGECLKNNQWPGYPKRIAYVGAPVYMEQQWLEREARESEQAT